MWDDLYKNVFFLGFDVEFDAREGSICKKSKWFNIYFTFGFFLSTLFSEQNSLDIFPVFHYTNKNFSVYMQLHIYIFL